VSEIRFIDNPAILAVDQRMPVTLIHVDEHGTAIIELQGGERKMWAADKLQPAECWLCKRMDGEMIISTSGTGRYRCVHAGPCEGKR
jgi:hypothetical protein